MRLDGRVTGRATVFTDFRVASLSERSASLEMDLPLAVGSTCEITLHLRQGQVDVRGRVVGVERARSAWRVGVEFLSVDEADRPVLDSFLERARGRAG